MKALSIKGLHKTYKNGVDALKGISFEVEKGDFFALLGPNGAGKTTTIGIITDLVLKTEGEVSVFGFTLEENPEKAKSCLGLVPQEFNFNIFEKVIDIVVQQAGYYGIERNEAKKRAEKYLKKLELWEKRYEEAATLSGGMKRKLMIVRALVHEPRLLILDEPTAGVDVETRRHMWAFLKDLNKKGTTIILTTHYLEEAEQMCRNIAIIDKGNLIENTSMKLFLQKLEKEVFVLDLKEPVKRLKPLKGYRILQKDDTTIEVALTRKQNLNAFIDHLSKQKIKVASMRNKTNRLEELFVEMTK